MARPASVVEIGTAAADASRGTGRVEQEVARKLDRIRALLADGAYPVDLDALAASIVDDERANWGADGER